MKKLLLLSALFLSSALYKAADAQINVHVNIGSQPVWGPVGYDYVEYYYMPEIDCYYHVPTHRYVYLDGRNWQFGFSLPSRYRSYDLYRGPKVVINEVDPFRRNDYWRNQYSRYRPVNQQIIYNSREPRYYVIKDHPEHNRWEQNRRNDYGNDRRRDDYNRNDNRYDNRNQRGYDRRNDDRITRQDRYGRY